MTTLRGLLARNRLPVVFGAIMLATGLTYHYARGLMLYIEPWHYVTLSNITLNFVLFLFLWGYGSEKMVKGSKRKKWVVFAVGLVAIITFFKFIGGWETIV